jgi:DNA primase
MVSTGLDLSTARDRSAIVYKLEPIIDQINDPVRQVHYKQKLANHAMIDIKTLEMAFSSTKNRQNRFHSPVKKQAVEPRPQRSLDSRPREEYCLTLLLLHPELKNSSQDILPEYFDNIENRELFTAWQQLDDPSFLKEKLDPALHDHLDYLSNKSIPPDNPDLLEKILDDCILALQEEFNRRELKLQEIALTSDVEQGANDAGLAKLQEQNNDPSTQLSKVFKQRARKSQSLRR